MPACKGRATLSSQLQHPPNIGQSTDAVVNGVALISVRVMFSPWHETR